MGEEYNSSLKGGCSAPGKSAFNWDIYQNRKLALQHLRRQSTLVDIILETEDGSAREPVHSQVISAFGDKLTQFIATNGVEIEPAMRLGRIGAAPSEPQPSSSASASSSSPPPPPPPPIKPRATTLLAVDTVQPGLYATNPAKMKLIRLPKVNKYTLGVLVECAYTGYVRTDLPSGGIWQVLDVADHYEMHDVVKACCLFLDKNLNRENCIHFYHVGTKHKQTVLQRNAWHHIRANFKYILNDDANNLATIRYEHFEPLLLNDKLNVDKEESVWYAIKLWSNFNIAERARCVPHLLSCMRFARFRQGVEFSERHIWRDPLIVNNREAQHQLAVLERNQRELLSSQRQATFQRDGFNLPCALEPRSLRPRVPHSILLAIGGWQQGQPTKLIESYDINCNMWFECKRKIMTQLAYHGVENINNLLYICGGTDGSEILNELFVLNPVLGECQQKSSMRESRCYVSTAHLGNFLYAMGGHNGVQRMRSVEQFDLKNEIWLECSDMNVARSDASACVYEGLIFIAGGLNDQVIESSVEFYNSHDDSWTFIQSMQTPRTSFTLLSYQHTMLAIGGNNGHERLNSVELYDFRTRQWSAHSQMRHRRSTFSAALLDDTKLVVVGGYNGQTPFAQVEMLDLGAPGQSWQPLQRIRYDRSGLKVSVVKDLPNAVDYSYLGWAAAAAAGAHSAVVTPGLADE